MSATTLTITIPAQEVAATRARVYDLLSCAGDALQTAAVGESPDECREWVGKVATMTAALDALGWETPEAETGCELTAPVNFLSHMLRSRLSSEAERMHGGIERGVGTAEGESGPYAALDLVAECANGVLWLTGEIRKLAEDHPASPTSTVGGS
jgi:hypothetical protein